MTTDLVDPHSQQQQQQKQLTHANNTKKDYMSILPSMTSSSSWHPQTRSEKDTQGLTVVDPSGSNLTQSLLADSSIKFPLENSWSFHFYKNDKNKNWKDNVKFITTVEFVEDFWG